MKILNISFFLTLPLIVAICAVFFFSWNDYKTVLVPAVNGKIPAWNIDECRLNENELSITGWAITPDAPLTRVRIYAEKKNKPEFIKVNYSIKSRPDVSDFMHSPNLYDKSGFIGKIRNIEWLGGLSGRIKITMTEKSGITYGESYDCK